MTFIEVLVSVVLLGLTGLAVLAALQVSVLGTELERDHSKAYQLLQSADGVLQATPRESCDFDPVADAPKTSGEEKIRVAYELAIDALNPPGGGHPRIEVLRPIKVWDGNKYWDPYDPAAPNTCFEPGFTLQLVTMQVTSSDGDIIGSIQVVKRD